MQIELNCIFIFLLHLMLFSLQYASQNAIGINNPVFDLQNIDGFIN